jgi:hypothetical protein
MEMFICITGHIFSIFTCYLLEKTHKNDNIIIIYASPISFIPNAINIFMYRLIYFDSPDSKINITPTFIMV